ncbi:hypothetical protein Tco_0447314 [Tanacetum coccineum]
MLEENDYDSDVDDEPNAAAAFMANLSSSSSQINEGILVMERWFDSQDVPTEAYPDPPSAIPPFAAYMLNTLSELTT